MIYRSTAAEKNPFRDGIDPCHRDGPESLSDILTDSTALWIEMDLSLRHYIIIVLIPTAQVLRLAFLAVSFF